MDSKVHNLPYRLETFPLIQKPKSNLSNFKTLGFAIMIIFGMGGLAAASVGVGGLLQVGSLSNLGQINSIIIIGISVVGTIPLIIIGIAGFYNTHSKNDKTSLQQQQNPILEEQKEELDPDTIKQEEEPDHDTAIEKEEEIDHDTAIKQEEQRNRAERSIGQKNPSNLNILKSKVSELLDLKTFQGSSSDLLVSELAKERLNSINPFWNIPKDITFCRGGRHAVLILPQAQQLVFKHPHPMFKKYGSEGYSAYYDETVRRSEKAKEVCEENNLYLLYVPLCKRLDVNTKQGPDHFIVQERVELESGDAAFQQSLWTALIYSNDPLLLLYTKELLCQLAIFICKMPYADAKYDNCPIMQDGRVALFDIDEEGKEGDALIGITKGIVENRYFGLFKMIPLEWFDEMYAFVMLHLPEGEKNGFQNARSLLYEKAIQRAKNRQLKKNFLEKNRISHISEAIQWGSLPLTVDLQEIISSKLTAKKDFWDLVVGRKIAATERDFFQNWRDISTAERTSSLQKLEGLFKQLQNQGKLFKFKIGAIEADYIPASITLFC